MSLSVVNSFLSVVVTCYSNTQFKQNVPFFNSQKHGDNRIPSCRECVSWRFQIKFRKNKNIKKLFLVSVRRNTCSIPETSDRTGKLHKRGYDVLIITVREVSFFGFGF